MFLVGTAVRVQTADEGGQTAGRHRFALRKVFLLPLRGADLGRIEAQDVAEETGNFRVDGDDDLLLFRDVAKDAVEILFGSVHVQFSFPLNWRPTLSPSSRASSSLCLKF